MHSHEFRQIKTIPLIACVLRSGSSVARHVPTLKSRGERIEDRHAEAIATKLLLCFYSDILRAGAIASSGRVSNHPIACLAKIRR